jgi:hypothetical protein
MNDPPSAKARSWKLLIQEFDVIIEYIKGVDHIDDDSLFCLLQVPETESIIIIQFLTDNA